MMMRLPKTFKIGMSHPYQVISLTGLPDTLRLVAQDALPSDEHISSIFVVPDQSIMGRKGGQSYVPEQALLFGERGVLHVQAPAGKTLSARCTYLPADGLLYARLSIMLLYGCLELVGEVNGVLSTVSVEFNTVGDHLLWPDLQQLVQTSWGQTGLAGSTQLSTEEICNQLRERSFKFGNGLQFHALHPAEKLLNLVFQPAIWMRRWRFLRRQISAAMLLALTDRQVILLKEEMGKITHGWIFTFYPLICITAVEYNRIEEWQEFTLSLKRGQAMVNHRVTLTPEAAQDWAELWQRYRSETGFTLPALSKIAHQD
jgi:hypothetical protein